MFGRKKSFGIVLSTLLLLSFSVTILPLDFLHNHKNVTECSDKKLTGTCHHKLHLTEKSSYCWICAIHFDKAFTKTTLAEQVRSLPVFSILSQNKVSGYFAELILSTLRGPPGN